MACETGSFFCLVRDHASAMIRFPRPCGDACRRMGGCTPLRLNRIQSVGLRDRRLRVRILSGAFRGRRPVAGRPVRNGKVAGSNPAGSTTCGMPPRVSADIPGNDVMPRRRASAMEHADSGLPPAATRMWCSGSTPASQAGDRGFEPRHPLHPENQNNGSDPTMGLAAVLPWGASGENMDEQPRHGHAASRNKETCHRPGSSEEEQVPFKHWVRIS